MTNSSTQTSPSLDLDQAMNRPMRRSQLERTEESDRKMLDAARDLIVKVGTQKTTLKQVGEQAGYSRGLAHARFGSKDVLFVKLSNRCRKIWIEQLQKAASGKSGLRAFISRLDAIAAFAEEHPKVAKAMYILWFESVGTTSQINTSLSRFHDDARNDIKTLALESGLISGRNASARAERYAVQFCGTMFGICYQWLVNEDQVDIVAHIKDMKREIRTRVGD